MSIKRLVYFTAPITMLINLLGAGPAWAHTSLVSSDPADGASVASGPGRVTLTFDEPVQSEFATVTVTGPGDTRWDSGEPAVSGSSVTAPVAPLGPAGDYVVGYRVVSADGHPVTGTVRFRLTTAGAGSPVQPADGPAPATLGDDGAAPLWPWIAGAVLVLAAGVAAALRLSRPRRPTDV